MTSTQARLLGLRYRAFSFLGAFLLFQAELIVAKQLLPLFGSSASVWTTCLMFYQGVLLLGYLYAGRLESLLRRRWVRVLHLVLAAATLAAVPFRAVRFEGDPILSIVAALVLAVGGPLLLLSTTSILAQRSFAASPHPARADPYFLYGTSNLGSFAALLTYPLVFEPLLDLDQHRWIWAALFVGYLALHALCLPPSAAPLASEPSPPPAFAPGTRRGPRGKLAPLYWMLLAGAGNALMLAATNALTLDAPTPLLWVVPLALYLATLIATFGPRPISWTAIARVALGGVVLALPMLVLIHLQLHLQYAYIVLHCVILVVGCLLAHANLSVARPDRSEALSGYYLYVALGGFLATTAIAIGFPVLLRSVAVPYLEYAVAFGLLVGALLLRDAEQVRTFARNRPVRAAFAVVLLVCFSALAVAGFERVRDTYRRGARTFYGLYQVKDEGGFRFFHHGNTIHGVERLADARQPEPLTYYHRNSPIGRVLAEEKPDAVVGVVGLGVGTLASYSRPGQRWEFFELDPEVEAIARQQFRFLAGAQAPTKVILGDARLSLERDASERYDLLVLDAFSSDAIPVHLLTREALALYLRKLAPGGVAVFNLSNRLFELRPVLGRVAEEVGARGYWSFGVPTAEELDQGKDASLWFGLAPTEREQAWFEERGWKAIPPERTRQVRPWTDAYVNYFDAL